MVGRAAEALRQGGSGAYAAKIEQWTTEALKAASEDRTPVALRHLRSLAGEAAAPRCLYDAMTGGVDEKEWATLVDGILNEVTHLIRDLEES